MFVNHRLAKVAAERELQEAQARIDMQQQLAAAQAQVHDLSSNNLLSDTCHHPSLFPTGLILLQTPACVCILATCAL